MKEYEIAIIGTGTFNDPRRPDLPKGFDKWECIKDKGTTMIIRIVATDGYHTSLGRP